ncbi:hypothetical protein [Crossiella sp. NPDC003009]
MTFSTDTELMARREARSEAVREVIRACLAAGDWVVVETPPPVPLREESGVPTQDRTVAAVMVGSARGSLFDVVNLGLQKLPADGPAGWFESLAPLGKMRLVVTWGSDATLSPAKVAQLNAEKERMRRSQAAKLGHRGRTAAKLFD